MTPDHPEPDTSSFSASLAPQNMDASLAHLQTLFERAPSGDPAETGAGSGLRVLAQIDRTYILATDGSGTLATADAGVTCPHSLMPAITFSNRPLRPASSLS